MGIAIREQVRVKNSSCFVRGEARRIVPPKYINEIWITKINSIMKIKVGFFVMPLKRFSLSVRELMHCITLKKMKSPKNAESNTRLFSLSLKCEVK